MELMKKNLMNYATWQPKACNKYIFSFLQFSDINTLGVYLYLFIK